MTQQCHRLPGQVETVIGQDKRTGDPAMSQVTWSGEARHRDCDRTQELETQQCHRLPDWVETVIGQKNRRSSNVTGYLVR